MYRFVKLISSVLLEKSVETKYRLMRCFVVFEKQDRGNKFANCGRIRNLIFSSYRVNLHIPF